MGLAGRVPLRATSCSAPSYSGLSRAQPAVSFGEQVASSHVDPWIDLVRADVQAMDYAFEYVPFPSAGIGAVCARDARCGRIGCSGASARKTRKRESNTKQRIAAYGPLLPLVLNGCASPSELHGNRSRRSGQRFRCRQCGYILCWFCAFENLSGRAFKN